MAGAKSVRFQYDAEVILREVEQLRAVEELAYRRVLDLIVVYRNKVIDDDTEMGRMTKTGDAWAQIKARLVKDHGLLYILDGFIRNTRYDAVWESVERSIEQRRGAGRASAAKHQTKKGAALPQPPASAEPAPQQASSDGAATGEQHSLPDPSDDTTTEPKPIVVEPVSEPMSGNGTGDGGPVPPNWQPTPEGVIFALDRGFTERQIEPLTREFVARNTAEGILSKDWHATWQLSVLRAVNSSPRPGDADQPMST